MYFPLILAAAPKLSITVTTKRLFIGETANPLMYLFTESLGFGDKVQ
jgi:hypothetical protein